VILAVWQAEGRAKRAGYWVEEPGTGQSVMLAVAAAAPVIGAPGALV